VSVVPKRAGAEGDNGGNISPEDSNNCGGDPTIASRRSRVAVVSLFVITELLRLVLYLNGVDG
jgi:hypothetical protein